MSNHYAKRIKVVGVDMLCFPANPITLEAEGTGCYDPWAWLDPEPAIETISVGEWNARLNERELR